MKVINNSYVIASDLARCNSWWRKCSYENRVFIAVITKSRSKYAMVHYDTFTKEVHVSDALNVAGLKFVLHFARYFHSAFEIADNYGWFRKIPAGSAVELAQALAGLFTLTDIFTSSSAHSALLDDLFDGMDDWKKYY